MSFLTYQEPIKLKFLTIFGENAVQIITDKGDFFILCLFMENPFRKKYTTSKNRRRYYRYD